MKYQVIYEDGVVEEDFAKLDDRTNLADPWRGSAKAIVACGLVITALSTRLTAKGQ
jgi:hypothetical protein